MYTILAVMYKDALESFPAGTVQILAFTVDDDDSGKILTTSLRRASVPSSGKATISSETMHLESNAPAPPTAPK